MKKKRLKKKWMIGFLFLLLLIILLIGYLSTAKKENEKEQEKKDEENIVEKVSKKLENIDYDFLKWVKENYPNSLEKMYPLLENSYEESLWHKVTGYSYQVLKDLYEKKYENEKNVTMLNTKNKAILSFVGDVSLADNWFIMPEYDRRGKGIYGILSEEIVKIMTESDLMVANSEFTVSNRGSAMPGKQYTFKASPTRLSIYKEMGVDLVTLANNHVYDFGQDAFLDMLDSFDEIHMPRIGAGRNLEEAMKPYYFIINGYKFAFLNATRAEKYILTPGATETSEGVFRCYDRENLLNQIKKVKAESDYVITILHYGKEGYHTLEEEQIASSKAYLDAGSDVIVGHHAHVLQGIEFYNHKPIIYNLGNFIFNSETIDTAIFQIEVKEDGTFNYYMIPALQKNEYTSLLTGEEKERVIHNLNSWSINAIIEEDGQLLEKP